MRETDAGIVISGRVGMHTSPAYAEDVYIGAHSGVDRDGHRATFVVLLAITVIGVGWELIYHFIQQFRWEKDWPTLFGLVTAINEGIVVWLLVRNGSAPWLPFPHS